MADGDILDDIIEGVTGEEKKTEVEEKIKVKNAKEVKVKQEIEHEGRSDWEILLLVVLAFLVGLVVAILIPWIRERLNPPEEPYYLPYHHFIPPPPHVPETRVIHPPHPNRKSDSISPEMIARTPESLQRHGVFLDEDGEAILAGHAIYETWTVIRDANGKIVDASRVVDNEE